MVALDVRGRARQAELALDWGRSPPRSKELVGYLIISRYVDAWHVMNLAVDRVRRQGVARTLLDRLFEVTSTDERRGYTLEVRVSNEGASRSTSRSGSWRAACAAVTTRTIGRTP